jgi:hypothetical protein
MPTLRFNHVFAGLMIVSFISALFVPTRYTNASKGLADAFISPLSHRIRTLSLKIRNKLDPPRLQGPDADRTTEDISSELALLRNRLARLEEEKATLQKQIVTQGDLKSVCREFAVIGNDSRDRDSITISGTRRDGLEPGMAVLADEQIVGRIESAGLASSRVRLITDTDVAMRVAFRRVQVKPATGPSNEAQLQPIDLPMPDNPMCKGAGGEFMLVQNVKRQDAEVLQINDLVVLDDASRWPQELRSRAIGRVSRVGYSRSSPKLAEIVISPQVPLKSLTSVQVLMKKPVPSN